MSNRFEIGKTYYGDFAELSYDWHINHNEDDICTEKAEKTPYNLYDCLFGDAVYLGTAKDCKCSYCNRDIQNGFKFRDEDDHIYNYGPECVNKAI